MGILFTIKLQMFIQIYIFQTLMKKSIFEEKYASLCLYLCSYLPIIAYFYNNLQNN